MTRFALILSILAVFSSAAQAQDRDAALAASVEALNMGQPSQALALADQVIATNPLDIDALLLRARALSALGQPRAARDAALAAYNASDIQPAQYASAMIVADLAASDGNYTLSQFWLRRAVQHTQTDAEIATVAQAYRNVRGKNPLSFSFSLGAAPNSNINNGSSEQIIMIQGLPFILSPTAKALSGWTAEATAGVQYKLLSSPNAQTVIGLQAAGRMNWLDKASAAAAPGVSGHDYDFYQVAAILTQSFLLNEGGTRLDLSGQVGRNWYGGTKLSDTFGAGAGLTFPIAKGRDALSLTARVDRNLITSPGLMSETVAKVGAQYTHGLEWGDRITANVTYTKSYSANAAQVYGLPDVGLEYSFGQPVAGALFTIGAHYGFKDYPYSPYTTTGRQDHILGGSVSAEFRNLSYMGFSPVVTVQANRTWSNVTLYSQQSISGGISLESRF